MSHNSADLKRSPSAQSPEAFFKGLFQKKEARGSGSSTSGTLGGKKGIPRRTSLLGPWLTQNKKNNDSAASGSGRSAEDGFGTDEDDLGSTGGSRGRGGLERSRSGAGGGGRRTGSAPRSSRVMSSRYWGGQYRVCTNPGVLREQLSMVRPTM